MARRFRKGTKEAGLAPGSVVYVGKREAEKSKLRVIDYTSEALEEKELQSVDQVGAYFNKKSVSWINLDGVHDTDSVSKLGEVFSIHSLILEDVVNTGQHPKMEEYDDLVFVVLKMVYFDAKENELHIEQVSFVLGSGFLISFQESVGDIFEPVRKRLRTGNGRIRKRGADYLLYALIDAVVDHYFLVLEEFGEMLENLDEAVMLDREEVVATIHTLKREMIMLRKSIRPLRDALSSIDRYESKLIKPETHVYFRDVYDHIIQVNDTLDSYRDMTSGLLDLHMTNVSNRMNQVMKVLTIIATIFIPLTFIAGIYGMNFEHMPELTWRFGYFFIWILMLVVAAIMVLMFKRKHWL